MEVKEARSMFNAVRSNAGVVIGSQLHNIHMSERFCLVLSEKAESFGAGQSDIHPPIYPFGWLDMRNSSATETTLDTTGDPSLHQTCVVNISNLHGSQLAAA